MIERLSAALGKEFGLTSQEIADVVWLALQMEASEPSFQTGAASSIGRDEKTDERLLSSEPSPSRSDVEWEDFKKPPSPQAELHATDSDGGDGFDAGLPLAVPDARSLREPLSLAKSLKPLLQKISAGWSTTLDEVATVERVAVERVWMPAIKPTLEPWLDLALVVEESLSMHLWQRTVAELQRLLAHYGVFRDVRVWSLATDDLGRVQIRPRLGNTARRQSVRRPRELIDPSGRRLILVATDCVSQIWQDGSVLPVLKLWASSSPMAIVQMLPEWLWSRTGLGLASAVRFHSLMPGVPNQRLEASDLSPWDEVDLEAGIRVPVVTLEPEPFLAWANMISARGGTRSPGFVFEPEAIVSWDGASQWNASIEESAEERVQQFRSTASPMARRLAGLLAAAPVVNLPVVRILRERLLPKSRQVHVAEVFLGGLLKPLLEIQLETDPDVVRYEFLDGVRSLLLESVPTKDSVDILYEVSAFVAERIGLSLEEFVAVLRNPEQAENGELASQLRPFARVAARILKQLGGEYAKFAQELERANQFATKLKRSNPSGLQSNSDDVGRIRDATGSNRRRNCAICIGINQYDSLPDLRYAVRDAESMRDYFLEEAGFEKVYLFTDRSPPTDAGKPFASKPTYGTLKRFFRNRFENPFLRAGDNLWFFFSGHGLRHADRDYLMPSDADPHPDGVEETAIALNWVTERLRCCGADNVVMLLDACRNGLSKGSSSNFVVEQKVENSILQPQVVLSETVTPQVQENLKDLGVGEIKGKGMITINSCSPLEQSYELDKINQGAFTYALLESLRIQGEGNCATVERLSQRLRYRLAEINRQFGRPRQTPYVIAEPASLYHQILLPRQASMRDIERLKKEALTAEVEGELDLAKQFWIRVLAISSADIEASKAYKRIIQKALEKTQQAVPQELKTIQLQSFTFTTCTVSDTGITIKTETKSAQYFTENLPDDSHLKMVAISGGTFMMGSPKGEGSDRERPQHQVKVKPFFMGQYLITQIQWKAVASLPRVKIALHPNKSQIQGDHRPVENISWRDAVEFCQRLSKFTGKKYRLPSEAEWEYACRADTTTPFCFGETLTPDLATYGSDRYKFANITKDFKNPLSRSRSKFFNNFGLFEMHGTLWEWCADSWHSNYEKAPLDGSIWVNESTNPKSFPPRVVVRGGSWGKSLEQCRSAHRNSETLDYHSSYNGFRVVCTLGSNANWIKLLNKFL